MPRPRGSPSSPAPGPNLNDLGHRIFGELVGDAYRLLRRQSGGVHRCESCRSGKPVPAFGLAKYRRTTQLRRRELRTSLVCGTLIVWAPHPRRVVGARLCSVIATPVLRHSAALLEGRSGAAALLGSSCAMVTRVMSAVDGRVKAIAVPQHRKARRPRGQEEVRRAQPGEVGASTRRWGSPCPCPR